MTDGKENDVVAKASMVENNVSREKVDFVLIKIIEVVYSIVMEFFDGGLSPFLTLSCDASIDEEVNRVPIQLKSIFKRNSMAH